MAPTGHGPTSRAGPTTSAAAATATRSWRPTRAARTTWRLRRARSSSPRAPSTSRGRMAIPRDYTSARLKTEGRFGQTYGRFEARMQIPRGQGIWPAFWLLGANAGAVGWPACGEIDIMENIGREPNTVHGTFHGPGYSGGSGIGAAFQSADGKPFADGYHLYAVEWDPAEIRWYVDDHLYRDAQAIGSARRHPLGVRPRLLHHPQRRGGWRVAGQSRQHVRLPAADEGGLRAGVQAIGP